MRIAWLIRRACRPMWLIAHFAFDFGARHQRGDGIDHDHVDRARAHQRVGDLERLLAGIGLGDEQFVEIDPELAGIDRIERVLGIDEGADAAVFWASAMMCRASVVLPDDSGPKISTTRPRGRPPMPSAMSRPSEPVDTVSTSIGRLPLPSRMIEPLPKFRSIWESAASNAFDLSMEEPSTRRNAAAWAICCSYRIGICKRDCRRGAIPAITSQCTRFVLSSQYVLQSQLVLADPASTSQPSRAGQANTSQSCAVLIRALHEMTEMHSFRVGNLVKHKSRGPMMVVEGVWDHRMEGRERKFASFESDMVEPVHGDGSPRGYSNELTNRLPLAFRRAKQRTVREANTFASRNHPAIGTFCFPNSTLWGRALRRATVRTKSLTAEAALSSIAASLPCRSALAYRGCGSCWF